MRLYSFLSAANNFPSFTVSGHVPSYAKDWIFYDLSMVSEVFNSLVPSIFRAATVGVCVFIIMNVINWILSFIRGEF